jgi:fucose permease
MDIKSRSNVLPLLIAYCSAFVFFGLVSGSIGTFIPLKAVQIRKKDTEYAMVFLSKGLGSLIGACLSTYLMKLLKFHHILVLSTLLISISVFLATQVKTVELFSFLYFLIDVAAVNINIVCTVAIMKLKPVGYDPWIKALHFCYAFGAFLSPLLVSQFGIKAYVIYPLLGAAEALIFYYHSRREPAELYLESTIKRKIKSGPNARSFTNVPHLTEFLVILMLLIYNGSEVSLGGWINSYAELSKNISTKDGLFATSLFWITFCIGRALAIPLSLVLDLPKQIVVLLSGISLTSISSFILVMMDMERQAMLVGALGLGLFMSGMYPSIIGLTTALGMFTTQKNTARYILGGSIGTALIPFVTGHILRRYDHNILFYNQLFYSVILVILYLLIVTRKTRSDRSDRSDRLDRSDRSERFDRSDRSERSERNTEVKYPDIQSLIKFD